ncbi:MAG: hypothetical protein RLZZ28_241 [Bacteroidota bacterium]|jgi:hypothetical protein
MKYSQHIGIVTILLLIGIGFLPLSYIASKNITVTGFASAGTSFGKPALLHLILGIAMLAMFCIPKIWSKRTNVLLAALNLAWSFRNYLLLSSCMMGECPEKKPALFGLVFLSALILLMAFLPKMELKENH